MLRAMERITKSVNRHCEQREAIQRAVQLDCFALLAMTVKPII
jgi:hypothetical protein